MVRVALGGTFDLLHRGHWALLGAAFEEGGTVLVGLTSDEMANASRKRRVRPFEERRAALEAYLEATYPSREWVVERIEDEFGPAAEMEDLEVLVVSENTRATGERINEARTGRGLGPLRLVEVPHVLADDGVPISSSRVLAGECDARGRVPGPSP